MLTDHPCVSGNVDDEYGERLDVIWRRLFDLVEKFYHATESSRKVAGRRLNIRI